MSLYSTALTAREHDTARRLESLPAAAHGRPHHQPLSHEALDGARLLRERTVSIPAAAAADGASGAAETCVDSPEAVAPAPAVVLDPAREALERTCLTVKRIAHDIGMPRATLEAYRLGTRRMPQVARARLGTYLAAHAAMLDGLAQALMNPTSATRE